jgi:hypothetical protein
MDMGSICWRQQRLNAPSNTRLELAPQGEAMRRTIPLIAISFAVWGMTLDAQTIIRPHPLLSGQLSFQRRLFGTVPLPSVALNVDTLAVPGFTCPMPVAHTDSAKEDPMPVAHGFGNAVPMPVVGSGCSNPLDRKR